MNRSRPRLWPLAAPVLALVLLIVFSQFGVMHVDGALAGDGLQAWHRAFHQGMLAAYAAIALWLGFLLVCQVLDWLWGRSMRRLPPRIVKDLLAAAFWFTGLAVTAGLLFEGIFSSLLALSGVLGIVVGLAIRPIILDVFAGLSTNMESAFQIGDWITIEGVKQTYTGWVQEVSWRTTHLRTRAGTVVIVPNSILSTSIITNFTRPELPSRIDFRLRLAPEVPTERAIDVISQGVRAEIGPPDGPLAAPAFEVLVAHLADNGIEYWVRFWMNNTAYSQERTAHIVQASVMRHLRMAGLRLSGDRRHLYQERRYDPDCDLHNPDDRVTILAGISLFQGLPHAALRLLARHAQLQRYPAGEMLVREAETSTSMYLVIEGHLEAFTEKDGRHITFGKLRPGDHFGEMALLTGTARTATVLTETPCVLFEINRETILMVLDQEPSLLDALSRNLSIRRRQQVDALLRAEDRNDDDSTDDRHRTLLSRMRDIFRATRNGR